MAPTASACHSAASAAAAMPALFHSLLAVTALLVTINGYVVDLPEPPGSLCHGVKIVVGLDSQKKTDHRVIVSFDFKSYGDKELHTIVDHCKEVGLQIIDQTVTACNGYKLPSAPNWTPPDIHAVGDMQLSPVFASCRNRPECRPIEFHVNQTCV